MSLIKGELWIISTMEKTFRVLSGLIVIREHLLVSNIEREVCSHCGSKDCVYDCNESKHDTSQDVAERLAYNGGLDALESLALEMASAGFFTENEDTRLNGIFQATLDALGNS